MVESHIPVSLALPMARVKEGWPSAGEGREDMYLVSVDSLVSSFPALVHWRAALQVS
jgi:hypothetical protein